MPKTMLWSSAGASSLGAIMNMGIDSRLRTIQTM